MLSYSLYLAEIDEGRSPNVAAPPMALQYWNMPANATLRDLVLVVRADEAHHRDINHGFANTLDGVPPDKLKPAPYPTHANDTCSEA